MSAPSRRGCAHLAIGPPVILAKAGIQEQERAHIGILWISPFGAVDLELEPRVRSDHPVLLSRGPRFAGVFVKETRSEHDAATGIPIPAGRNANSVKWLFCNMLRNVFLRSEAKHLVRCTSLGFLV